MVPRVTNKLPPMVKARHHVQPSTSHGYICTPLHPPSPLFTPIITPVIKSPHCCPLSGLPSISPDSRSNLTSPNLAQPFPNLTSPHLTSPHLTSPHLTSPHLTSPHLTSPPNLHYYICECNCRGYTGPSSSGASLQSQSPSDESSDSEAPRDRQKYLRVMTESRGGPCHNM